eukprot:Skav219929  [mRNA]  locus=scaffold4801:37267:37839:- [translate_table: standard]
MAAAGLLQCLVSEGMALDDFALALLRACFEGWVSCTKRSTGCRSNSEVNQLRAEVAKLRSELVESQRVSAFNEARVKQLELQMATEQEWNYETDRFCEDRHPPASSMASPSGQLEQVIFERDQALVEREQLRLELTAMQLVRQSRSEVGAPRSQPGSSPRSPRFARAQLAAVTRQLQDCCVGLAPTGCQP